MSTVQQRIRALRDEVQRQRGGRDSLTQRILGEEKYISDRDDLACRLGKAIEVLQAASETRRQELKDRVESLVTRGLRAVFGRHDYTFAFTVTFNRGVFGVVPVLRSKFKGEELETEIVEGHGGGIADVVSFVLRVVILSLARPRLAPVLVLDESFKHVSAEFLRGVGTLLKELNVSAGIQFILVTHRPELMDEADVIYRTQIEEGRTTFILEHDIRDELYHTRAGKGAPPAQRKSDFDGQDMTGVAQADEVLEGPVDPGEERARLRRLKKKNRQ
jgi:hypothetical protein